MKRIYPLMILTAALLVFSSCSDSGSGSGESADPSMTAAATGTSYAVLNAVGNAMLDMGATQGSTSRDIIEFDLDDEGNPGDKVTTTGSISMDSETGDMSMNLNITFDDYSDGTVTLKGTIVVIMEMDGSTGDMEGSEKGTITAIYEGSTIVMIMDIKIVSSSDGTGSISGTVTVDGTQYSISESLSE